MLAAFLLSFIISYILNPYVNLLQKLLSSRTVSILIILSLFFVLIIFTLFFVIPPLYYQTLNFINKVPDYVDSLYIKMQQAIPILTQYIDFSEFNRMSSDVSRQIIKFTAGLINQVLHSTLLILNSIIMMLLTPVIIFYFLNDWEKISKFIDEIIPRKYYDSVKLQMSIINNNISGYIRGQLKICLILGVFYSISLTLAKVEYSLFIGITTGILSFIPYVGTIFGFVSSHLVAFYQFDNVYNILIVTILFITGQVIETLILTPKLIGKSVNLHPVWVIFAIILSGRLLGFIGVLLSIPVASIVAVLIRLLIKRYKSSEYYEAININK